MLAIDPRWLTSTVCDLVDSVRCERDVSLLPILSDALIDAGCDDGDLIHYLRTQDEKWVEYLLWFEGYWLMMHEREPHAEDVLGWMSRWSREGIVESIKGVINAGITVGSPESDEDLLEEQERTPMKFAALMNAATAYVKTGESEFMGRNMNYQDLDFDKFWKDYAILTGEDPGKRDWFFHCAC